MRGLVVGGVLVVVVDDVLRDFIRDVMKARGCGSVIILAVTVLRGPMVLFWYCRCCWSLYISIFE